MTKTKSKTTKAVAKSPIKAQRGTKSAKLIGLLGRGDGASITELMKATGWLTHSVRGFMAGSLKKQGKAVTSSVDQSGNRRYRLAQAGS
jgi:hypothetical protein